MEPSSGRHSGLPSHTRVSGKSARPTGWLLVGILFLVGGLFLAGLFLTARWGVPAEYRNSTPGVPAQALRIACLDLHWKPVDLAAVVAALKEARADFVLLQGVSRKDAQAIGDALGMRHGGQLQMVYSPGNSDDSWNPGNAILAKHPLFRGRVMLRKQTNSMGVVGEAVVSGKRFMLASVDTGGRWTASLFPARPELEGLNQTWSAAKEPPLIAGGDWKFGIDEQGRFLVNSKLVAMLADGTQGFVLSGVWKEPQVEKGALGSAVIQTRAGN